MIVYQMKRRIPWHLHWLAKNQRYDLKNHHHSYFTWNYYIIKKCDQLMPKPTKKLLLPGELFQTFPPPLRKLSRTKTRHNVISRFHHIYQQTYSSSIFFMYMLKWGKKKQCKASQERQLDPGSEPGGENSEDQRKLWGRGETQGPYIWVLVS